jgi:hypothetical protein
VRKSIFPNGGVEIFKEQFLQNKCAEKLDYMRGYVLTKIEYTLNMFPSFSDYWVSKLRCVEEAIFSVQNFYCL